VRFKLCGFLVRFVFVFLCRENFCVFQRKDFFYSSLTTNNKRLNTNAKNTSVRE
jgi:hypothetical protein